MTNNTNEKKDPIFYGGQAVMEGVMMRGGAGYALAVRKANGEIVIIEKLLPRTELSKKLAKIPIVRGAVAFGKSFVMGYRVLNQSAEIAMQDIDEENEEPPTRFEQWLTNKFGDKLFNILLGFGTILSVVLGIGLFMLLPTFIGGLVIRGDASRLAGVVEGLVRIVIFVVYVFLISRMKDIQRVFQYHGAEHMAINCHESKQDLTADGIAAHSRLHKRCGTSFMLIVMVVSMLLFMVLRIDDIWLRLGSRILLLPVIAGISYEISVKWAGKYDNWLVRAITAPGMLMQQMTTKTPDAAQIEVAVAALEAAMAQDAVTEIKNADFE